MDIHLKNKSTECGDMVGVELCLNNALKEEPVFYPEEESDIPYFSANNDPLDIKSEDCLVGEEVSTNWENPQDVVFSANNDPLNIQSEDVDIVVVNGLSSKSVPKKIPNLTKNNMMGEIIKAESCETIKMENEFSANNDPLNIKSEDVTLDLENEGSSPSVMKKSRESTKDDLQKIIEAVARGTFKPGNDGGLMEGNSATTSCFVTPDGNIFDCYSGRSICGICGLSFKMPSRLKKHLIVHKSPSEVPMHKCEKCPFETKYKTSIGTHMSNVHGNPSQLKKFSCEMCDYKTNHTYGFKKHLIMYHSPLATVKTEKKVHKCKFCEYTAKKKTTVDYHSRVHMKPSELTMDKCPLCPYQSKYPSGVANHMLRHKSSSEVPLFKCELCPYESKWRHCLRNHLKVHENNSEHITIRKCEICEFTTNNIYSLEVHMKVHRVPPKKPKETYTCYTCGYQTKDKRKLVRHILKHKPIWQQELFECAECGVRLKTKKGLGNHIMIRHGPLANINIQRNF